MKKIYKEECNMANNRCTYQQVHNVSIPKQPLLYNVVDNDALSKKDLRVCLFLFTILDGYREPSNGKSQDPKNFKVVFPDVIADQLDLSVKDVKKSLRILIREEIIEEGDANGVEDGLRFCF